MKDAKKSKRIAMSASLPRSYLYSNQVWLCKSETRPGIKGKESSQYARQRTGGTATPGRNTQGASSTEQSPQILQLLRKA